MRRLALVLVIALTSLTAAAQQLDSALTSSLDPMLDEYFAALETEPVQVKLGECDFMLETCTDSLVRQYVAVRIYDHFLGSKVMGDESVAVHMVDDWFAPGKVSFYNDIDLLNAKVYAQFHRNSLIGMKAPVLAMRDIDGNPVSLPAANAVSILFFYDTSCAKCKLEVLRLRSLLEKLEMPLDFYAVYSGAFKEQWEEFIGSRWNFECPSVRMHHLWDPELESDFQMLYGVLQTPQMLLVDRDGRIVGRGLDTDALTVLLETVSAVPYEYGDDLSLSFFEKLFEEDVPGAAHLIETAEYLKEQTLASGDSTVCKHLLGDYFYYLLDTPGEEYRLATSAFIDTFIFGDPSLWTSPEDTAMVIRPAEVAKDLLNREPVGSRIPDMKVQGVLLKKGMTLDLSNVRKYRLRGLRGRPGYIVFHIPGCSTCDLEIEAVKGIFDMNPSARVLLVNPEENGTELLDTFDLMALPNIFELDRKGTVKRKYMSFL